MKVGRPKKYKTDQEREEASRQNQRKYQTEHQELRLLNTARVNARLREIPFELTVEDIEIPEYCPLLGIPLTNILGKGRTQTNASLDRLDSKKGYTKDNIWIISDLANRMKQDATPEQLLSFAEGILRIYS